MQSHFFAPLQRGLHLVRPRSRKDFLKSSTSFTNEVWWSQNVSFNPNPLVPAAAWPQQSLVTLGSFGWLPDFGTANKENHRKSAKQWYSTLCPILILEIFGEFGDGHIPAGPYDITTTIMQWNGMQKDTSTLAKESKKTCAQTCMSGSKEREPWTKSQAACMMAGGSNEHGQHRSQRNSSIHSIFCLSWDMCQWALWPYGPTYPYTY